MNRDFASGMSVGIWVGALLVLAVLKTTGGL